MNIGFSWYEQWASLPLGLRHLLFYGLYAAGNKDEGIECVLTIQALIGTRPLEATRIWEVFNVREGSRVSQWVTQPEGLFDQLIAETDEYFAFEPPNTSATWNLLTPHGTKKLLVTVSRNEPISVCISFSDSVEPAVADKMLEYIVLNGMNRLFGQSPELMM
jgi:hypothetical protein